MIKWNKCSEKMPEHAQRCLLYAEVADKCLGPIVYDEGFGGWMNILETPEGARVYLPNTKEDGPVSHWAQWNGPDQVEF
jgi:hypothetical protein